MRLLYGFLGVALAFAFVLYPLMAVSYSTGAPAGFNGAPSANGNCTACHFSFPVNSGTGDVAINAPTTFVPGETITFTVSVDNTTPPLAGGTGRRQGFQVSVEDDGGDVGTLVIADPVNTQFASGDANYVTHTAAGNQRTSWTVRWTAPDDAPNAVTIYAAGNAGNGGDGPAGDYIYTDAAVMTQASGGVSLTATASQTTVAQGGSLDFTYTITNNTASAVSGDVFYVIARGGSTVAQARVFSGTLPPGVAVSRSYTQSVPLSAPTGTYTYALNIGRFPNTVVDSETFTITVTPASSGSRGGADAWTVSDVQPWPSEAAPEPLVARSVAGLPAEAVLEPAYPNPFAGATTLGFALPEATEVTLEVLDVRGRRVALLAEGAREAGRHTAALDASGLPSGTYLVRLRTEQGHAATQRITLLR